MEPREYIVIKIEGEYATLQDIDNGNTILIAMALLPPETDLHVKLHYACFSYTLAE